MIGRLIGIGALAIGVAAGSSLAGLMTLGGIALTASDAFAKHDDGGGKGGKGGGRAVKMGGGGHGGHAARGAHGGGRPAHVARIARGGGPGHVRVAHSARNGVHVGRSARIGHDARARVASRGAPMGRLGHAAAPLGAARLAGGGHREGLAGRTAVSRLIVGSIGRSASALGRPGPLLYSALAWTPIYTGLFWPSDSRAEYWPSDYDTIYEGAFMVYGAEPPRRERRGRALPPENPAAFASLCQDEALAAPDVAMAPLEETLEPNDAQRATLVEFKAAMAKAADLLKTACVADLPSSPVARLDLMDQQTGVTIEALAILRPALEKLEKSLNEEQRARFALVDPPQRRVGRGRGEDDLAAACEKRAAKLTDWPVERIAAVVRPTEAQRDGLVDLWAASTKAAHKLKAECTLQIPATPLARLEMMQRQLDVTRQAVKSVRLALADFYKDLTPEQKARFDVMSGPEAQGRG